MFASCEAKTFRAIIFSISALAVLLGGSSRWLSAQQSAPQGPPQFTTYPVHSRMLPARLENGHVVYVPPVAAENMEGAQEQTPGGNGGGGGSTTAGVDFGLPAGTAMPSVPTNCSALNSLANFDATCALDSYQGEPMLAVGGGKWVGGQNDIYPGNCSASAAPGTFGDCGMSVSVSSDGQSFQRFKLTRNWGGHDYLIGFDPSVARDSQGNLYAAYGVADGGVSSPNGVVVVKSADGASWTKANPVVLSSGKFEDKYWIAADATPGSPNTDRLYVAWDRNQGNNQILMVSFSSNGGQTWSSPKKVNDGTSSFERVIYAFPAVAPNHTVHVLWLDYARNKIFIDKSTNGGATWGTDVAVATTNIGFGKDIGCNGGRSMSPAPQMAIFPNTSSPAGYDIYVSFANQPTGTGQTFDVFVTKSINGGATWSAPQRVTTTSTGHQYNPAITVDSNGAVNVSYLDRRDDPNNCQTNTYLSRFSFGGTPTDYKITDAASNFNGNPNGPGDYSGIASVSTTSYPYFADHRNVDTGGSGGGFEIYTAAKP